MKSCIPIFLEFKFITFEYHKSIDTLGINAQHEKCQHTTRKISHFSEINHSKTKSHERQTATRQVREKTQSENATHSSMHDVTDALCAFWKMQNNYQLITLSEMSAMIEMHAYVSASKNRNSN